jgi:hypothetical protein
VRQLLMVDVDVQRTLPHLNLFQKGYAYHERVSAGFHHFTQVFTVLPHFPPSAYMPRVDVKL